MPYIQIQLSKPFTTEQLSKAKTELGSLISIFEDKDESKLMLDFCHGEHMFFRGESLLNGGYAECRLFGYQTYEAKKEFTEAMYKVFENTFGIQNSDMFITYAHHEAWGTTGSLKRF